MRVSVCMATYNGERYIAKQLETILSQIGINDEVVISDDSSTDNTIKIIESFKDSRIRLFKENSFHNATYNFENALRKAAGDFIFLSDQDDIWLEDKVKEVIQQLRFYDLVVSDCVLIDDCERIICHSYFGLMGSKQGIVKNFIKNPYLGCCMAFRRSMLEKCLPFPNGLIAHDIWIGFISQMIGKVLFLDLKLVLFRRHTKTASYAGGKSKNSILFRLKYRIAFAVQLIRKYRELACESLIV